MKIIGFVGPRDASERVKKEKEAVVQHLKSISARCRTALVYTYYRTNTLLVVLG